MAKELPYFQFEPAEYLTRDISFCSLSAQGMFVNLCAYYWQRGCVLTKSQILRRLNYEDEFNELVNEGVIDLNGENITIKFLDDQMEKATKKSQTNSENGAKGGRPKKPKKTESKPNQNQNESESKGIREEKIKKENKRGDEADKIDVNNKEVNEPLKIDSYYPLEILKNNYLGSEKTIKAVLEVKANGFKDEEHLKSRLNEFISFLMGQHEDIKTPKDFASHFRNWHKSSKPAYKDITKQRIAF